jgi:AcrR family transcriptional regulator
MTRENYHHGDLKNALIQAGIEILAEEGLGGLSLRKAARKAGVSHAAPYAHFADKQNLIAAIASDGHQKLNERLQAVMVAHADDPLQQLIGAAWAYVQFGLDTPAHYKITFSGVIQDEHGYPEFMQFSQGNLQILKVIVDRCREAGILNFTDMDAEMQVVSLWGLIHGLVSLIIQGQVPSSLLKRMQPEDMVISALQQVIRVPIDTSMIKKVV